MMPKVPEHAKMPVFHASPPPTLLYVMGFLIANYGQKDEEVLLTLKNRPEWQRGLWNGIGGKINDGEEPVAAMVREAEEETRVLTMWREFAVIECLPEWRVHCYIGGMPGNSKLTPALNNIGERMDWWGTKQLPRNRVGDLDALLSIAKQKLIFAHARITYRENGIENNAYLLKDLMRLEREAYG